MQGLTGAPLLLPGTPGKLAPPEVPQTYQDTALVLWKPGDSKAPCTYTLERRVDGKGLAGWSGVGGQWRVEKLGRHVPSLSSSQMAPGAWATSSVASIPASCSLQGSLPGIP